MTHHIARLTNRSLFRLSGADAENFLDNLITCDVVKLAEGQVTFGGLLTPQGKVLFDFHILREKSAYLFDCPSADLADLMKRLSFYKLRADVTIEAVNDLHVFTHFGKGEAQGDGRLPSMGTRSYASDMDTNASFEDWNAHRLEIGVPLSHEDFDLGTVFPHDVLMDQFVGGGVDFTKGCYVGQEVVSRMKHRDSARNRFVKIRSDTDLPPKGTPLTVDARQVGVLGSSSATNGLALVRIDKIGKAMDAQQTVMANEQTVSVTPPDFASFGWGA